MLTTLIAFLGACTLVAASPGPSTVLIIRQSLHSRRSGFLTVLGNETGVFIWGVVAAFGLTALLTASEVAYDVMRIVGAVVLVGFGVQTLRQARRGKGAEEGAWEGTRKSGWASYRGGLLLNLANPKAAVFALSFLPQFVPESAPPSADHDRPRGALGGLRGRLLRPVRVVRRPDEDPAVPRGCAPAPGTDLRWGAAAPRRPYGTGRLT